MGFLRLAFLAILAAQAGAAPPAKDAQDPRPAPQVPAFRSTVTLVPIDVRVIDKAGKPVTDLKQDELTVMEDGVSQQIGHFLAQTFATEPLAADAGLVLRESTLSVRPQTNRIFLFMLGRGRLQVPSRTLDALVRFVRQRLLPQDQVAVFAYDRATPFTRDHQQIAALLDRFNRAHEQIDFEINFQMSTLAAIYGSSRIPRSLQQKIDRVFEGTLAAAVEPGKPGAAAETRIQADARRQINSQEQREQELAKTAAAKGEGVPVPTMWTNFDTLQSHVFSDLSFEDFVSATAQTLQDLGNLYAGIEYLRHFEGEKHLVFVTERGLTLTRLEEDQLLANTASDARVAIDTVETGGLYVGQSGGGEEAGRLNQLFAFQTLQNIAELTGGVASIAEPGTTAMERIDRLTRGGYLVGYYPTNANWNGAYRKVTVRVSRPGTTVYYRHGYFARREVEAFRRRDFVSADRIRAAAAFGRAIKDIGLDIEATVGRTAGGGFELSVDVTVDPSRLKFSVVDGAHVGRLTLAVFCWDEEGNPRGNAIRAVDLRFSDDDFGKIGKSGIPYQLRLPASSGVRRVRVVVYDYEADLVGSADTRVL